MMIQQDSVEDYIDHNVRNSEKLITHSYIAKAQAKYLKERKQDLEEEAALFLGDFAENYKFIMQDEVQGFIGMIVSAPTILLSFTALKKAQ